MLIGVVLELCIELGRVWWLCTWTSCTSVLLVQYSEADSLQRGFLLVLSNRDWNSLRNFVAPSVPISLSKLPRKYRCASNTSEDIVHTTHGHVRAGRRIYTHTNDTQHTDVCVRCICGGKWMLYGCNGGSIKVGPGGYETLGGWCIANNISRHRWVGG